MSSAGAGTTVSLARQPDAAAGRAAPKGRRRGPRRPPGLPWILPAFVFVVGLIYYCIGYTGYISTLSWDGVSPSAQHIGLANYTQLYHDPVFWDTIRHTVIFVNGIPDDLFDAARVDGASAFVIFWRIILPLTRPIAAAIVILTLIGAWNDYLLPLVFLQTPGTETITLLPTFFVSEFSDDQTKVVASAVITAIPEIIAYLCLQRLFERGLTAGALK